MELPAIPDEAYQAALDANYDGPPPLDHCDDHIRALDAAWPLLYQAALRHAADHWDTVVQSPGFAASHGPGVALVVRSLRGMADEATP